MMLCAMDGRGCVSCAAWCRFIHGDPTAPHDAEMAAARDADRVARVAEGGGL